MFHWSQEKFSPSFKRLICVSQQITNTKLKHKTEKKTVPTSGAHFGQEVI